MKTRTVATDDNEVGCIVSLCVAVYFDANSFFLATGRRSRIVEIGR